MKILFFIFLVLFFISVFVTLYAKYDYIDFIKKSAGKYTIEEIDSIIQKDNAILEEETLYDKTYIDAILDNIELWEEIRNYKLHKKF
jgi:hypothetical protein